MRPALSRHALPGRGQAPPAARGGLRGLGHLARDRRGSGVVDSDGAGPCPGNGVCWVGDIVVVVGGGAVPDRLLVDVDRDGRARVSAWLDGDLPSPVGDPVDLVWPLSVDELEDLRWYLEDYLRAPFGVYEERGPQIAGRLQGWGQPIFAALFARGRRAMRTWWCGPGRCRGGGRRWSCAPGAPTGWRCHGSWCATRARRRRWCWMRWR